MRDSLLLLQKFLASELPHSPVDRTILKTLSFWIGVFTIARNKPICAKYLNLKAMIVNEYPQRLDIIIPIVTQILRATKESRVFSP